MKENKGINSKKILNEIEKNKKNLREKGVKKIGLFGSFAKNKQKKKSDIDFLVEFEKITFDNYIDVLIMLKELFKRKIDLIIEGDLRPELNYVKEEAQYVKL